MDEVDGFNAKFAVLVTSLVGTMWCAYLFTIVALLGLSTALGHGGEGIIAWIAQTFLQLVLLSVIMVGQNVQSATADARAAHTYTDVETILDRLDLHTQGGLEEVIAHIDALAELLRASKPGGAPPSAPSALTPGLPFESRRGAVCRRSASQHQRWPASSRPQGADLTSGVMQCCGRASTAPGRRGRRHGRRAGRCGWYARASTSRSASSRGSSSSRAARARSSARWTARDAVRGCGLRQNTCSYGAFEGGWKRVAGGFARLQCMSFWLCAADSAESTLHGRLQNTCSYWRPAACWGPGRSYAAARDRERRSARPGSA
jgi:hypothetical protein